MATIDARKAAERALHDPQPMIRLEDAVLCVECDVLHTGAACPKCGGRFGWLVGRWLAARAA